jgi:hypothetical protein
VTLDERRAGTLQSRLFDMTENAVSCGGYLEQIAALGAISRQRRIGHGLQRQRAPADAAPARSALDSPPAVAWSPGGDTHGRHPQSRVTLLTCAAA